MPVRNGERGQTLAETALFLPVVLLVLFGIQFMSQYGDMNVRAQLAVRYGGLQLYNNPASVYSAARVYNYLSSPVEPPCLAPPVGVLTDSNPLPGPSSAPYWQPTGAATTTCTIAIRRLGGAKFLASHFFSASVGSITANVTIPAYLSSLGLSSQASASEPFVHPADPSTILHCSQEVYNRVSEDLNDAKSVGSPPGTATGALTYTC